MIVQESQLPGTVPYPGVKCDGLVPADKSTVRFDIRGDCRPIGKPATPETDDNFHWPRIFPSL